MRKIRPPPKRFCVRHDRNVSCRNIKNGAKSCVLQNKDIKIYRSRALFERENRPGKSSANIRIPCRRSDICGVCGKCFRTKYFAQMPHAI